MLNAHDRRLHCGQRLKRYRPLGHSFGGTIIAKVAEAIGNCIRRLIFLDAFVLNDGESLRDSLPPHYQALFDSLARESDDHTVMPFELWRASQ